MSQAGHATRRRGLGGALFLLTAPIAVGCSTVRPASFNAKPPELIVPARSPVAVSVSPRFRNAAESRFNANGMAFKLDRNEFSAELARLLVESLDGAGVPLGGERQIQVEVVYLDFMFRGPCILDYNVGLGAEPAFGMQSRGESSNFAIACRKAFESAVQEIVADARTIAFLEGE